MATDLMIQAEGLTKRYGETQALAGVDITVPAGTILGLLGPNGAGKTTAVRVLTTLARPDSGSATVAGIDVLRHPAEVRRHIGVAAQDATLDPLLTGRQNLVLIGELSDLGRAESRARAKELLAQFELTDAADRVVKGYSGGMRRRLDLAGSLMTRPPVLFLDEPTTGLDPTSRQRVWEAIRELLGDGVTVLLTTQYLEEADELANDIVVVDHGRVIAQGTPQELKKASRGARLEVTLAEPHASAVGRHGTVGVGPGRRERRRAAPSAPAWTLRPAWRRSWYGRWMTPGCWWTTSRCDSRRSTTCSSRSPAATSKRKLPATATDRRREAVRPVLLLVQQAPLGPARTSRTWKEYAHDDDHADTVSDRFRRPTAGGNVLGPLADIWAMTRRNIVHISREPMQLSDVTIQPLLFTVLFVYIFGGAIPIPGGGSYVDFLLAGILALNLTTSTMGTAVGLSTDLHEGMIDRFRTLPMWRSAVLVGRSVADFLTSVRVRRSSSPSPGSAVGWRPGPTPSRSSADSRLLLLFAYAVAWVSACVGLNSKSPESAASFGFIVLFPLTFVSNAIRAHPAHAGVAPGHRQLEPGQRSGGRSPRSCGATRIRPAWCRPGRCSIRSRRR